MIRNNVAVMMSDWRPPLPLPPPKPLLPSLEESERSCFPRSNEFWSSKLETADSLPLPNAYISLPVTKEIYELPSILCASVGFPFFREKPFLPPLGNFDIPFSFALRSGA